MVALAHIHAFQPADGYGHGCFFPCARCYEASRGQLHSAVSYVLAPKLVCTDVSPMSVVRHALELATGSVS